MLPRCQIIPLPDDQVSFVIDGKERLRWHHGAAYPRPFFYPLIGPAGRSLTRMGHPGAPDHDHHRSIWFAHEKVSGVNFWGDRDTSRVRQKQWLAYQDGDTEAIMAVQLGWYDGHDPKELMEQELIAAVRTGPAAHELLVELQTTFRPTADSLELGKTNFGFLAVRMAKHLSEHFGSGELTSSEGGRGEPAIFGKPARWVNYATREEGIAYLDHVHNPGYPNSWHVRADGWMGNAVCLNGPINITRKKPLQLRYLLVAHAGRSSESLTELLQTFHALPRFEVVRSERKHIYWEVRRVQA